MLNIDRNQSTGWDGKELGDWSAIGKRVLEAAQLATAVHERLAESGTVNTGAAVEPSQDTYGWKTHDVRNVALSRGLAG